MKAKAYFNFAPLLSLWRNRYLVWQMTRREVIGRYRGSALGLAWSFFNPILMLVIYTFVFSTVFKTRWGVSGEESQGNFAIILFVGMIVHGLFAECINRAPQLIISNVNYVKKVVFPLEIDPVRAHRRADRPDVDRLVHGARAAQSAARGRLAVRRGRVVVMEVEPTHTKGNRIVPPNAPRKMIE